MKHAPEVALDLHDYYGLVAIWEFNGCEWKLMTIARLASALALCRAKPHIRLAFPTEINPNRAKGNLSKLELSHADDDSQIGHISNTELVEGLIKETPGINLMTLATKLDISTTSVRKHLKKLELQGKVQYRFSRADGRKLYYPGEKPPVNLSKTQTRELFLTKQEYEEQL